jgi:hypothetical protein
MDRNRNAEWFAALLTAGSFLAMVSLWIVALLDALAGSASCQLEFAIGFACALAFISLVDLPVQTRE